jgi:hypothetical protein
MGIAADEHVLAMFLPSLVRVSPPAIVGGKPTAVIKDVRAGPALTAQPNTK